jgi:hypothetical protein
MQLKFGNKRGKFAALTLVCLTLQSCGGGGGDTAPTAVSPTISPVTTGTAVTTAIQPSASSVATVPTTSSSAAPVAASPVVATAAPNAASASLPTAALNSVNFGAGYPVKAATCGAASTSQFNPATILYAVTWTNCTGGDSHYIYVYPNALMTTSYTDKNGTIHYQAVQSKTSVVDVDYVNRTVTFKDASYPLFFVNTSAGGVAPSAPLVTTISGKLRF